VAYVYPDFQGQDCHGIYLHLRHGAGRYRGGRTSKANRRSRDAFTDGLLLMDVVSVFLGRSVDEEELRLRGVGMDTFFHRALPPPPQPLRPLDLSDTGSRSYTYLLLQFQRAPYSRCLLCPRTLPYPVSPSAPSPQSSTVQSTRENCKRKPARSAPRSRARNPEHSFH
jgi:hypothetical protein